MSFLINSYRFGVSDPSFTNVSLLLHGDGTNGSTTIVDSSPSPKAITALGNAKISTAQSKFGGSSILFDGNGDKLTIPQSSDFEFGTGDLTIEFWALKSSNGVNGYDPVFINQRTATLPGFIVELSSNRGMFIYFNSGGSTLACTASTTVNDGAWHHWAVCRSNGTWFLFKDGTSLTKSTDTIGSANILAYSPGHFIGSYQQDSVNYDFNGYIDDFRITKGIARYTANFTSPSAPFPDK